MGYTRENNGKQIIVVSQWALDSGMIAGLLIHELSHIYRIQAHHPSHNGTIHAKAIHAVLGEKKLEGYQEEIVHTVLNCIMDLYADDIFFKVWEDQQVDLSDFFLSWIRQPVSGMSKKDLWTNAGNMVNAAFARANLERHHREDTNGKVANAVNEFLSKSNRKLAEKFPYFAERMKTLPESITDDECTNLLIDYLRNFLSLTEMSF
jgi:hypothetical protein